MNTMHIYTEKQSKIVNTLVKNECCNYDEGNCLLLDDGETHCCPQLITYSLLCQYFRRAVLPLRSDLEDEILNFEKEFAGAKIVKLEKIMVSAKETKTLKEIKDMQSDQFAWIVQGGQFIVDNKNLKFSQVVRRIGNQVCKEAEKDYNLKISILSPKKIPLSAAIRLARDTITLV